MIALKAILHPTFYPSSNNTTTFTTLHPHHNTARRRNSVFLRLCSTNSNDEPDNNSQPGGDVQSQELLAQLATLQTEKVRLTDYLDERSEYLTQFGEEAKAEIDKIGEDALKGLDEVSDRITAKIEGEMLAFEELNELNRIEFEEIESKVMEKMKDVTTTTTSEKNGRKTRKNVYLFFIGLFTYGIVGSVNVSSLSSTDWKRVAVLGAILVALFSQFIYEQNKDNNQKDDEQ